MKEQEILYINTDDLEKPRVSDDLYDMRENFVKMQYKEGMPEVTIWVQAYNRLDKTKRCIESILKHTKNINYELILVDNGSEDTEIMEYYKTVSYEKKKIIRVSKNLESSFPYLFYSIGDMAPFLVLITNDIIVTPNWLHNMLVCIKSDKKIGMVNPSSSNVSNCQLVQLEFDSYEEMEKKAEKFNKSDPRKWEERIRLITIGTLFRKEAIYTVGMPLMDIGFYHDFGDDDLSYRIRRNGYKLILAKDTWIHHDHDVFNLENKDPEDFINSINVGRKNFIDKYHGMDAWEQTYFPWMEHMENLPKVEYENNVKILGVDTRNGDSLLVLKNYLRTNGIFDVSMDSFIQDAKYREEQSSICNGKVECDRIEHIRLYFEREQYDYIILGDIINSYEEPLLLIQDLLSFVKKGGVLLLRLENMYSYVELLNLLGERNLFREQIMYNMSLEQLGAYISEIGEINYIGPVESDLGTDDRKVIEKIWGKIWGIQNKTEDMARLFMKEFVLFVRK